MSKQREAITEVLDDVLARAHFGEDVVPLEVTESQAAAVINYLYQRADDPEVVEAYTKALTDEIEERHYERWVYDVAAGVVETMLEAVIGPRPNGEEAEHGQ